MTGNRRDAGRLTLRDVADRAGVSRSTVSAALKADDRVRESTRQRVVEAAEEIGYVYNRSAAGLRTSRTQTIGLMIGQLSDPFLAKLLAEIDQAVGHTGRTAFLCNAAGSLERQARFIRTMREYNAEGLLICPVGGSEAGQLDRAARSLPVVQIWSYVPGAPLDAVLPDDLAGMTQALDHLVRLGHRNVAFLGGDSRYPRCHARLAAFRQTLDAFDLPAPPPHRQRIGPVTRADGMMALYELLDSDPAVTGVLCDNDEIAFGVLMGLINAGRRPGRDMAVIGWNSMPEGCLWQPGLTSISNRVTTMSETAVRMLDDRVSGSDAPPRLVRIRPTLDVRQSCGSGLSPDRLRPH